MSDGESGPNTAGDVAADATVLIFLGKLRRLDDLRRRYSRIHIPSTVYEEVVERGKDVGAADAVRVESAIEEGWIKVHDAAIQSDVEKYDLEAGETAVLSLALNCGHDEVLADEESVREVARIHDLEPRGTLHVLFLALRDGDIDFDDFVGLLESLLEAGFYLDEAVYLEAVRQARRMASDVSNGK